MDNTTTPADGDKTPMLRGYLIDPEAKTVSAFAFPASEDQLSNFYALMRCSCVDVVRDARIGDVWIDDEGLFKNEQHHFAVDTDRGWRALCGRAIVLDHDGEGNSVSTTTSGSALCAGLLFLNMADPYPELTARYPEGVTGAILSATVKPPKATQDQEPQPPVSPGSGGARSA